MEESPLHPALPSTMTKENLAIWITENRIEEVNHVAEKELLPEDVKEYEHKSSMASRTMDDLEKLKKDFIDTIVNGTEEPVDFTIPPTKGLKLLKKNRQFADQCIKDGRSKQDIKLYALPDPEQNTIVHVDIEGTHYPQLDRDMNENELARYERPLLKAVKDAENETSVEEDAGEKKEEKKETKKRKSDFMSDQTELTI
jgi:hypothetical protein